MLSNWKKPIAACLVLSLLPFSPQAVSASKITRASMGYIETSIFDSQAVVACMTWFHKTIYIGVRNTAGKSLGDFKRTYKSRRHFLIVVTGIAGIALFLSGGSYFERWVQSWADGSVRLTFLSLEIISLVANFFVSLLSQAYTHEGPSHTFRLDWRMIGRQLLVAAFFTGLIESAWYVIALPHIIPGQSPGHAILKGLIDQCASILFLDPINQYLKFWIVKGYSRKEAFARTRQTVLKFYLRSAPLWLLLVTIANSFSNLIVIFVIVNIAMMIWDFQLYVSDHEYSQVSADGENLVRPTRWASFVKDYERTTDWILGFRLFRFMQALIDSPWYETALWRTLTSAYLGVFIWLFSPLWTHQSPAVTMYSISFFGAAPFLLMGSIIGQPVKNEKLLGPLSTAA
jgi:hypothetical protein